MIVDSDTRSAFLMSNLLRDIVSVASFILSVRTNNEYLPSGPVPGIADPGFNVPNTTWGKLLICKECGNLE